MSTEINNKSIVSEFRNVEDFLRALRGDDPTRPDIAMIGRQVAGLWRECFERYPNLLRNCF